MTDHDEQRERPVSGGVTWVPAPTDRVPVSGPPVPIGPVTVTGYRDDPAAWPTAEQLAAAWVLVDGPEFIAAHPDAQQTPWGRRLLAAERDRPAGCDCQHIVTRDGAQLARLVDDDCPVHGAGA